MSPRLDARALASVIALATVGCTNASVDRMEQLTHDACACKTSACADAVVHKVAEVPVAATAKTRTLAHEMLACVARRHEDDLPADGSADSPSGSGSDSGAGSNSGSAAPGAGSDSGSGAGPAPGASPPATGAAPRTTP